MKQMKYLFTILTILSTVMSCVKVEEEPVKVDADPAYVTLIGVNDCFIASDQLYWSSFTIDIPINNIDKIFIEKVIIEGEYGTLEENDVNIVDNAISLGYCFLFGADDYIDNKATIHATNKVGEKIGSTSLTFSIERPLGAN